MLVLSRRTGEKIVIGDDIEIVVQKVAGGRVAIGVNAPNSVRILRGELEAADDFLEEDSQAVSAPLLTGFASPEVAASRVR